PVIMDGQQQRSEILTRTLRVGKADDDSLLRVNVFYLQPVRTPLSYLVPTVHLLCDHALEVELLHFLKKNLSIAFHMIAIANDIGFGYKLAEFLLPLHK